MSFSEYIPKQKNIFVALRQADSHDRHMIVVDSTVLIDFWVGEPEIRVAAHRLLRLDQDWISVSLSAYEVGNVLRTYVRTGRLPELEMRESLLATPMLLKELVFEIDHERVWEISLSRDLSYYDAAHVWLALSKGLSLYTRDKKVLKNCSDVAVEMPVA